MNEPYPVVRISRGKEEGKAFQENSTAEAKEWLLESEGPFNRRRLCMAGAGGMKGAAQEGSSWKDWLVMELEGPRGEVWVLIRGKQKVLMDFEQEQLPREPKTGLGP